MNYGNSRYTSDTDKLLVRIFFGSLMLMFAMYFYLFTSGQFDETWLVATRTFPLYLIVLVTLAFGLVWWKKQENFTTNELFVYIAICVFGVYPAVALGFLFLTDLHDTEIWNGEVTNAEWTEKYYTESTDSDGNTDTTYYGPYYKLLTSNGESVSTSKEIWSNYVQRWGGPEHILSRRNTTADGEAGTDCDHDGRPEIHTISWNGKNETRVASSVEHVYANYLKASKNVLKVQGALEGHKALLGEYPRVYDDGLGQIAFNRVIAKNCNLPQGFASMVDGLLDEKLRTLGPIKQCNVVVYVAGTTDIGLFQAIQEYWRMGKKNDIVICIGYVDHLISWCRVMSWTDHKMFLELLERRIRDLKTLSGQEVQLVNVISSQITARGEEGFLRKPMSDFKYLAADVEMPLWVEVVVIVFACLLMMPTILIVIKD